MSNWCKNSLTVRAPAEKYEKSRQENLNELSRFKQVATAGKNPLETNKFIRYPKKFKILDKAAKRVKRRMGKDITNGFNRGGYEWCCENWGTKLGIFEAFMIEENMKVDGYIKYGFYTAWIPPVPVIKKMSDMFPRLCFDLVYNEHLTDLYGRFICLNGKLWYVDEELRAIYGFKD